MGNRPRPFRFHKRGLFEFFCNKTLYDRARATALFLDRFEGVTTSFILNEFWLTKTEMGYKLHALAPSDGSGIPIWHFTAPGGFNRIEVPYTFIGCSVDPKLTSLTRRYHRSFERFEQAEEIFRKIWTLPDQIQIRHSVNRLALLNANQATTARFKDFTLKAKFPDGRLVFRKNSAMSKLWISLCTKFDLKEGPIDWEDGLVHAHQVEPAQWFGVDEKLIVRNSSSFTLNDTPATYFRIDGIRKVGNTVDISSEDVSTITPLHWSILAKTHTLESRARRKELSDFSAKIDKDTIAENLQGLVNHDSFEKEGEIKHVYYQECRSVNI